MTRGRMASALDALLIWSLKACVPTLAGLSTSEGRDGDDLSAAMHRHAPSRVHRVLERSPVCCQGVSFEDGAWPGANHVTLRP
jgi:hypothetical protein